MEEPKHDTRRGNQSARIAAIIIWLKLFWTPSLGTSTGQIPTAVETAGGGGGGSSCVRPRFRNAMRRRWQLSRPFPDSSLGKHVAQLSRECRWQVLLAGSAAWLDVPTLCSRVELCTSAPAQALALVAARSGLAAAPPLQVRSPHLQLCLGALLVMYRSC